MKYESENKIHIT